MYYVISLFMEIQINASTYIPLRLQYNVQYIGKGHCLYSGDQQRLLDGDTPVIHYHQLIVLN